jgi:hypothetical protein
LSWNSESSDTLPLDAYLNRLVFNDESGKMGNLVLDMGRYNKFEEFPMLAMTTTNMALRLGMMDKVMFEAINTKLQKGLLELATIDSTANAAMSKSSTIQKLTIHWPSSHMLMSLNTNCLR